MPKGKKRSEDDAGSTAELNASLEIDAGDESATSGNDRCDFNTESWGQRCRTNALTPINPSPAHVDPGVEIVFDSRSQVGGARSTGRKG